MSNSYRLKEQLLHLGTMRDSLMERMRPEEDNRALAEYARDLMNLASRIVDTQGHLASAIKAEAIEREWQEKERAKIDALNGANVPQVIELLCGFPLYWKDDDDLCPGCSICKGKGAISYDEERDNVAPCPNLLLAVANQGMQHAAIQSLTLREGE